jgi:hypothetical protein
MTKNRFEQVDEPQEDAITLALEKEGGEAYGTVACPVGLAAGRLQNDVTSDKLPAVDAFRAAVRLANEFKAPIVVMDPHGLWQTEWGRLYTADE